MRQCITITSRVCTCILPLLLSQKINYSKLFTCNSPSSFVCKFTQQKHVFINNLHLGIGLSNQRESTIVWDRVTGLPYYNCIVWLDNRTTELVDQILDRIPGRDSNYFKDKTGLPISTYFSALKLKWLIQHVLEVRRGIHDGRLLFGTVDSWILWKLTGGCHYTDVTNAARTLLMDLHTLDWDKSMCEFFDIPSVILPQIKPSGYNFGPMKIGALKGTPITSVIGDQQAALVGQGCFDIGQTKVTFGTGCFLVQNIGPGKGIV